MTPFRTVFLTSGLLPLLCGGAAHAQSAGKPPLTVQMPALPASAQASHWPVHAVSQQRPSTQCCDPHWFAPPQAWPCASSATQTPAEHQLPAVQSESALQLPLHALGPHENGAHVCVWTAGQAPAPSHEAARVAVPPAQEGLRQEVESPGYVQAAGCVPSQLPAQNHLLGCVNPVQHKNTLGRVDANADNRRLRR